MKEHFCPAEKSIITYQDKCNWCGELESQEPVAWMYVNTDGECEQIEYGEPFDDPSTTPLYTHPPQRTEPTCPECKAGVLYECVACSCNNYPPQRTEQEPVGTVKELFNSVAWEKLNVRGSAKVYLDSDALCDSMEPLQNTIQPQRTEERNFCSRCGKRTADLTTIHTCTPPQD